MGSRTESEHKPIRRRPTETVDPTSQAIRHSYDKIMARSPFPYNGDGSYHPMHEGYGWTVDPHTDEPVTNLPRVINFRGRILIDPSERSGILTAALSLQRVAFDGRLVVRAPFDVEQRPINALFVGERTDGTDPIDGFVLADNGSVFKTHLDKGSVEPRYIRLEEQDGDEQLEFFKKLITDVIPTM